MQEFNYWLILAYILGWASNPSTVVYLVYVIKNYYRNTYCKNKCPKCNSPLSLMRSTALKECTSCDYKRGWKLDEGQLPLVANNRMVKRNERNR